jgi:hypothetical protein
MISAQIATATSSGERAPMSRPIGAITRVISASPTPASRKRLTRSSWVLRDPIAPM